MDRHKRLGVGIGLWAMLLLLVWAAPRAMADPVRRPPARGSLPAGWAAGQGPHATLGQPISAAGTITVTQVITGLTDTEIVQGYPLANCAGTLAGRCGYDQALDPDGQIVRTLIRFSLASLPPGAVVSQAMLELYVAGAWGYNESLPLEVYRLTEPWVDVQTTWNHQPAFAEMFAGAPLPFDIDYWQSLNVTDLVQKWQDGTHPNEGIVLRGHESPVGWRAIARSKTTKPPRLRVTYSYTPGFALLAVPDTHTLLPGQAVSSTVYADAIGGFSQPVNLGIGGLPPHTTYALGSSALTPPNHTTLWLTTTASTPLSTYTITLTGTSGSLVRTATVRLRISQPDFDLLLLPAEQAVVAGGSAHYTVDLEAVSGFAEPVTLSLDGLPGGVIPAWAQNPLTPSAGTTLTLTTSSATPTGRYTLTITGAGGGRTHNAQAAFFVNRGVYLPLVVRTYSQGGAGIDSPESNLRAAAGPESLVVLSIGIADYLHMSPAAGGRAGIPGWDLAYTIRDATVVHDNLRANSECPDLDEGLAAQSGQGAYRLLLDAQATKAAIHDALANWLAPLEGPNTTVVIMFSGHGMYAADDDGDDGDGYDEFLVPYEIGSPDGIHWDETMAIRDDELAQWLGMLESQRIVILIDSCFSGGMFEAGALQGKGLGAPMRATQWQDGFAQDIEGSGRVILTASTEAEPSWEFGKLQHGAFTYYLLEAFRTAGADLDGNGWISAQEAYTYLAGRVNSYVHAETGSSQHPQLQDRVGSQVDLVKLQPAPSACPFGP